MTVTVEVGALAIIPGQREWTAAQEAAFASIGLDKAPTADRIAFLHLCQSTGLDPWRREIFLIKRKTWDPDTRSYTNRWTPQTGIDGYLHMAEETGDYLGCTEPEFCGPDGVWRSPWTSDVPPVAARVGVRRRGFPEPVYAVAMWREYVPLVDEYAVEGEQRRKTGHKVPGGLWGKMPTGQLAKVARALALRIAFPRRFAGLHVEEEMHQADALAEAADADARAEAAAEARRAAVAALTAGKVIDGETADPTAADPVEPAVYDREALLAEFAEQARVLGKTPTQLATRWTARHKRNFEQATDEELFHLVDGNREIVKETLRHAKPNPDPGPHPFRYNEQGDNDRCAEPGCGGYVDDPRHDAQPAGQDPLL